MIAAWRRCSDGSEQMTRTPRWPSPARRGAARPARRRPRTRCRRARVHLLLAAQHTRQRLDQRAGRRVDRRVERDQVAPFDRPLGTTRWSANAPSRVMPMPSVRRQRFSLPLAHWAHGATADVRGDEDSVADTDLVDLGVGGELDDRARRSRGREHARGVFVGGVFALVDPDVGATDATGLDLHARLAGPQIGVGSVSSSEGLRPVVGDDPHATGSFGDLPGRDDRGVELGEFDRLALEDRVGAGDRQCDRPLAVVEADPRRLAVDDIDQLGHLADVGGGEPVAPRGEHRLRSSGRSPGCTRSHPGRWRRPGPCRPCRSPRRGRRSRSRRGRRRRSRRARRWRTSPSPASCRRSVRRWPRARRP